MDTTKPTVFTEIIRSGSMSKAAEILGYSQPTLTHMMKSLESEIGVSLISRHLYGIRITNEGKALLPVINRLILDEEELLTQAGSLSQLKNDILRIGS